LASAHQNNSAPLLGFWAGKHRDVAGAVVIEILNSPVSGAVAVLDYGDLPMKRAAHRHILEAFTVSKPRLLGGLLGGYHFLGLSGMTDANSCTMIRLR
jgi:hypothetical protein